MYRQFKLREDYISFSNRLIHFRDIRNLESRRSVIVHPGRPTRQTDKLILKVTHTDGYPEFVTLCGGAVSIQDIVFAFQKYNQPNNYEVKQNV